MTSISLGSPVLADTLPRPRAVASRRVLDVALIATGTALVAACAQLAIPFWPVPLTMQTFAVLVVGVALGPARGVLALALYLVLGVLGVPIFAGGASGSLFALTSGGYIIGFVVAAALVGWLARRSWDRRVVGAFVTFVAGSAVIYAFGLLWLGISLDRLGAPVWGDAMGYDSVVAATLGAGLYPFLVGDLVKALLAAAVLPLAWKGVAAADARTRKGQ